MKTLTKAVVLAEFRSLWRDRIQHNRSLRGDCVAKREAFNNYVDFLNKQGAVSDSQAFSWANPF